jgi:hypothetical protein
MSILQLGADAPVFDGCFADNLAACLKDHAIQHDGYKKLKVVLDDISETTISILCIEHAVSRVQGPIACDECRVLGALSGSSWPLFMHP